VGTDPPPSTATIPAESARVCDRFVPIVGFLIPSRLDAVRASLEWETSLDNRSVGGDVRLD
jgi:hypothetical protein